MDPVEALTRHTCKQGHQIPDIDMSPKPVKDTEVCKTQSTKTKVNYKTTQYTRSHQTK